MNPVANNETVALSSRVRHRAVDKDGVLVHLDNGRVIIVNEVGLYIVQLLTRPMTHAQLIEAVAAEFEVSNQQAASDLDQFLGELGNEQLLGPAAGPPEN